MTWYVGLRPTMRGRACGVTYQKSESEAVLGRMPSRAVCGFWAAAGAGTGAGTGAGAPVAYGLDGGGAGAFPPHPARAAAVKTIDTTTLINQKTTFSVLKSRIYNTKLEDKHVCFLGFNGACGACDLVLLISRSTSM